MQNLLLHLIQQLDLCLTLNVGDMADSIMEQLGAFIGAKLAKLKKVAFSNNYNDLDNKPTIPTVSSWALQKEKPKYTASEVNAIPTSKESDLLKKSRIFKTKPMNPEEGDLYIKV